MNVLGRVFDFIKEAFAACFLVIIVILLWGIAMPVMTVAVFNPVIFPLLAMIWPKKMAAMLFAYDSTDSGWLTNGLNAFWRRLLLWEVRLMPWHARWRFVDEAPERFSKKNLLKYYRLAKDGVAVLKHLRHRGVDICEDVWHSSDYADHLAVVKASKLYNEEHIAFMLQNKDLYVMLSAYAQQNTLSADVLRMLIKTMSGNFDEGLRMKILKQQIIKNGLPADMIEEIIGKKDELARMVSSWLEIYSQCKVAKKADKTEWLQFCRKTSKICAEAQKLMMTQEEIEVFYASGHKMAEDAIFSFLSRATKNMRDYAGIVHLIFSNEKAEVLASPRIKAVIDSSAELSLQKLL
ncbi:MAG: hypothetical protein IJ099_02700 [Alphaproteobacteria bacterium]|nr:hypothetical protein [Alphaproteobacteria bacterium]